MTNYKIKRGIQIPPEKIDANPWNPNVTSTRQQEAIAESLGYYGQVLDILVRPHPSEKGRYQIIDGEHRFQELKNTAQTVVATVIELPDYEAKKLTVILNETRGEADLYQLGQLLGDIQLELEEIDLSDEFSTGLPYTPEELEEMTAVVEYDWDGGTDTGEVFGDGETKDDDAGDIENDLYQVVLELSQEDKGILDEMAGNPKPKQRVLAYSAVVAKLLNKD